jgi:toxin ParE1/3/4
MIIRFTKQAKQALRDVAEYTLETYGEAMRLTYIDEILAGIDLLERFPQVGSDVAGHAGVKKLRRGRHIVYYELGQGETLILAVLHEKQLPSKHV